ncbi:alpha-ketoacid dehydrogenase subunit alpha/beta [Hydrotalea sandarakina]|jgi:pyruvate/2-oxoglutarate/acetoin dehydrogenase E1 component/TPP-dependent pyruvate/acetoin dehydrogenase alpha subunit|uniref:3-methyl-2-oxobutanoate dehydrogenase (2-methylpropanoyl-transferring) n=1 Tax=Hydrotalea sandarakina TaxID=1004304 RepID=A0A2W7S9Q2_9BACT|nr:alpha-ketoacid dehydrogenase subunit alpha/beta [Hydrotalea sandarakina]PZX63749.1 pyruvate/2-oxoglutarate/acetoin dehydrogenase E1 component [Hydrotalea sandarakina]
MEQTNTAIDTNVLSYEGFRQQVLNDFKITVISREASLLGRKEVLTGKAKFGIFGDGKELAQVAMARYFQPGDFRSGYYRDQTFMFATGLATVDQFFSQLYADPNIENDPFSAGRQMVSHFATPNVDENGNWLDLANRKNISSDIAPTAGQMPRSLGLAFASKCFRNTPVLQQFKHLSNNGNEICFCTIGDASTSEGPFWETINAAGVLQVPLAVFVWDDGYGISVPREYQTTKGSISEALQGMQKDEHTNGINIYKVKAWDYAGMCEVFEAALQKVRETHTPALFHVEEVTQPQGHSTSGSHERYKSAERLAWEREWDCIKKFREWIVLSGLATDDELNAIAQEAKILVKEARNNAWEKFIQPIKVQVQKTAELLNEMVVNDMDVYRTIQQKVSELQKNIEPLRRDVLHTLHVAMEMAPHSPSYNDIQQYYNSLLHENNQLYNSHLYNEGTASALKVETVKPLIPFDAPVLNGYEILNRYFDILFANNPKVLAFGEDVGNIGDVNQGFAGLQAKHGNTRIFDTGIRELTIMGQAIGLALRGLRPIAEIQYIDYLLYGLQTLSDDAATTHYRTFGRQSCPVIVRTRGHRLEGIWHSGSPMGLVIHALRGFHVCVPRNMVQAVGMYNTLLKGNDPGIVIECLNGYRLKEKLPANLLEFTVPLGVPEIIRPGDDITLVSYGSTLRIVEEAAERLAKLNVSCEVLDVQTLLPFDINHDILKSLKKTNRILFIDEDVPGGAAAYMFNKVMEEQGGYRWVDVAPRTLTAQAHRPAYGSDGDYFSKPNAEDVVRMVLTMMQE